MDAEHSEYGNLPVFLRYFCRRGSSGSTGRSVGRDAPNEPEEQGRSVFPAKVPCSSRTAGGECAFPVHSVQSLASGG